jgi:hypothetical protein
MAKAKLARNPVISKEPELSHSLAATKDAIAQRAYELYVARGCEDGHHLEDWLQAERELQETNETSKKETSHSPD